ncbi:MAG: CHAT domain-containing protein, partial [Symploca sp. SIO2B6]|nr:CHAT domain-containing protein [Symploca sp. SIO2B6]
RLPFKRQLWLGLLITTLAFCIGIGQMKNIPALSPSPTDSSSFVPFPLLTLAPSPLAAFEDVETTIVADVDIAPTSAPTSALPHSPQFLLNQGRSHYEAGQLPEALNAIRAAVALYRQQDNALGEAVALSNFALVQEQLGNLATATRTITASLDILTSLGQDQHWHGKERDRQSALAQSLNVQAQILLAQGQPDAALASLGQATVLFDELGNEWGVMRSQIRRADALQSRGFHQEAIAVLQPIYDTLEAQPSSPLKVSTIRNLATVYYQVGNLGEAEALMSESLDLAQRLNLPKETIAAQLGIGNIFRAQAAVARAQGGFSTTAREKMAAALDAYQTVIQLDVNRQGQTGQTGQTAQPGQAEQTGQIGLTGLQAQLNRLSLLIETDQIDIAATQWQMAQAALATLPPSRAGLYAHINLAKSLMALKEKSANAQTTISETESQIIEQELRYVQQQAYALGDRRAEAFALGYLGEWYEFQYKTTQQKSQWDQATTLTQEALLLSNQLDAQDMTYQWHWQMGRLLADRGEIDEAIAAYQSAVQILDGLRVDLVKVNLEVQFSFQENVEPIHRELVNLLLQKDDLFTAAENRSNRNIIQQAQKTIESLQLVELTNFLREACINLDTADLGQVDQVLTQTHTAVVYPIILSDRLEIILSLPERLSDPSPKSHIKQSSDALSAPSSEPSSFQTLTHVTVDINESDLDDLMDQYYQGVYNFISIRYRSLAQKAYDVLMRPIEEDLASRDIDTLVFVLDGVLRNVPMAALNDGEQFLVEKYSIALTPGIQLLPELLSSQPLKDERLSVAALGLSEGRQGFLPLPNVENEIEQIRAVIPATQALLNEHFTQENFVNLLSTSPSPIVHLATHGQFSSQQENTFVLTWDEKINVSDLSQALRVGADRRQAPIELLVLSACETASGDRRAALGLAGVAIRAGARSTVASLWQVDDAAAAEMMGEFYAQIASQNVSKAEALRQAQLKILNNPQYRKHPYYWAPFVLVGNWL